ncbi:hypothetical protein DH2020_027210 [Rehmannia glutinosa]|uniref:BHLH domain-containing protein n=1 Tax=Rehmannia glutinosa TaxID=99300 RepID=A0ABR0VUR1_REHGL
MGSEESGDRVFEQRGDSSILNYPFYGCNWDPIVFNEFGNQTVESSSHLLHFPSDMVPKISNFGSGSFSEMVTSFGHISETACHSNIAQNSEDGTLGPSPYGKRKRKLSPNNAEEEQHKDPSGDTSDFPNKDDDEKQKFEQNIGTNSRSKQAVKQAKDNLTGDEISKENYIHVRAKRGQATNSHSLAERVRRERISERMRLLQELVPGCNKITGKAMMLDEIINYVQSLQQQVEFLSMKLATVNPELNVDIDRILFFTCASNPAALGIASGLNSSHPFPGYPQGTFNGAPGSTPPFNPLPQHIWSNELQGLLQMGFDHDPSASSLGRTVRGKGNHPYLGQFQHCGEDYGRH